MSFKDIIKSSVLDKLSGDIGVTQVCIILLISCIIGAYIFFVYKGFSKSAFYSKDFNISLVGMTIVVAAIMIAIQSSLVVSLGMVGALSIVRFRTAIKNPMDLLYLFWSISAGIICGIGLYYLAAVLCIIITVAIWILNKVPAAKAPVVVIIRADAAPDYDKIEAVIKAESSYFHQASSMVKNGETELLYEIKGSDKNRLVTELSKLDHVKAVSCLEHDGEVRV